MDEKVLNMVYKNIRRAKAKRFFVKFFQLIIIGCVMFSLTLPTFTCVLNGQADSYGIIEIVKLCFLQDTNAGGTLKLAMATRNLFFYLLLFAYVCVVFLAVIVFFEILTSLFKSSKTFKIRRLTVFFCLICSIILLLLYFIVPYLNDSVNTIMHFTKYTFSCPGLLLLYLLFTTMIPENKY